MSKLSGEESVVTKQGVWLNKDWVVVNNIADENESILYREEEIERLRKEIDESSSEIKSLESELESEIRHCFDDKLFSDNIIIFKLIYIFIFINFINKNNYNKMLFNNIYYGR